MIRANLATGLKIHSTIYGQALGNNDPLSVTITGNMKGFWVISTDTSNALEVNLNSTNIYKSPVQAGDRGTGVFGYIDYSDTALQSTDTLVIKPTGGNTSVVVVLFE